MLPVVSRRGAQSPRLVCVITAPCFGFEAGDKIQVEQIKPRDGDYVVIDSPEIKEVGIYHRKYIALAGGRWWIGGLRYIKGVITSIAPILLVLCRLL